MAEVRFCSSLHCVQNLASGFLDNPSSERVIRKMEENKNLKEAVEKLDEISADEKMQRIAELREKAIMDEKAIYRKGIKDGMKERNTATERKIKN